MKYCITTLAIGGDYEKSGIKLFSDLKKRTKHADFSMTTTNQKPSLKKINNFIKWDILDETIPVREGRAFYYNLKSFALKPFIKNYNDEKNKYDFVIYIDSDWSVNDDFDESKFLLLFEYMTNNDIDMVYERPGLIKDHKTDPNSLVKEKIIDYGINEHTKWDNANVMNEQFVVYRNNWKFNFYIRRWEQFFWYSVKNNINNFAEGLEMGICALESEMKLAQVNEVSHIINETFYFYNRMGIKFLRY
jgi:hypothetical protein